MIEKEFTVCAPIVDAKARLLLETGLFQATCEKTIYPKNIRKIVYAHHMVIQTKKRINKETRFIRRINNIILDIDYKESEETLYDGPLAVGGSAAELRKVVRYFFFEGSFRWSLNLCNDVWTLECENEQIGDIEEFAACLVSTNNFLLFGSCFTPHNVSLDKMLHIKLKTSRKFVYNIDDMNELLYFAPKLDGTKYIAYIHHGFIKIPERNKIFCIDELFSHQIVVGIVEEVNDTFHLIDISQVILETGTYVEIGIIDAVKILQSITINCKGLGINIFSDDAHHIRQIVDNDTEEKYDGYLGFTERSICKYKSKNTIDLLYVKPKKKTIKLETCISFGSGETIHQLGYSIEGLSLKDIPKNNDFVVIEFEFVVNDKKLIFGRFRHDKIVANTFSLYEDMSKEERY